MMLTLEEALALLGAVGTDDAPTVKELRSARTAFVDAAKVAKEKLDRKALASMLEAIKVTEAAISEAEATLTAAEEEINALTADIPELNEVEEAPVESSTEHSADVKVLSVAEAIARLGLSPAPEGSFEVAEREPAQTLTINGEESNGASWGQLGDAFAKFSKSSLRSGRTTLATFRTEYSNQLTGKAGENTRIIDDLARRSGESAIVAAGGACSLAEPIRDQPMLASLERPIASALPTIGASTGKVTFFGSVCLPQDGANRWTNAQDLAVDADDPDTWKTVTEIDCDDIEEVTVEAIYSALTIGNFQHRFAPERWEAILHAVAASQARLAEQTLFEALSNSDHTTQHTIADTGSVYNTVVRALLTAAATIRQNQRYEGRRFRAILPSWVRDAAELDLLSRAIRRGRSVEADALETILARGGVDPIWSPDIDPIEPAGQVDGPLTEFPDEAQAVLFVDGGAFRLDGGEINLGTEIRDHDLNRQNKVATFTESFETAFIRGCDAKSITIPVTVCDAAPCLDEAPAGGDEGTG